MNDKKNRLGKALTVLLEKPKALSKVESQAKYEEDKIYRKNIDLPGSALNVLEELAADDKRKLKPYLENLLIDKAERSSQKKI